MQYIAVFNLFSIPVARGFASLTEAINYLDQRYIDPDSTPLGVYDVSVAGVITYQLDKDSIEDEAEALIINIAQSYIERSA